MLIEKKFTELSSEKLKKLSAIKNAAELDGLLSEYGIELTGDEKAEAFAYFSTGKRPLSDDDLDMVTGGGPMPYETSSGDKNTSKIDDRSAQTAETVTREGTFIMPKDPITSGSQTNVLNIGNSAPVAGSAAKPIIPDGNLIKD